MNYQVLARKCRPQTFDEVIGQQHVTRTLTNAIGQGRIAHAYLFTGERGVGKTSIARILAKAMNCHSGPTASPCGTCASCEEITRGTAIDVHEIDGASNTSVEDVRVLRENARYMPSRDRYKIYVIDEVHMLSKSAFNALLKTLEEPPAHVLFIFATTEPHKIPDTILSRCIRFDFKRIPAQHIISHLESIAAAEGVRISRGSLALIAREAEGSMRDAQTLLERALAYCGNDVQEHELAEMLGHVDRRLLYRMLEAVIDEDAQACIAGLADACEYGVDLQRCYFSFLEMLRNLTLIKKLGDTGSLIDLADEDRGRLAELAGRVSEEQLLRCFRLLFSAEAEIVRSSYPRIALEICLLEMISLKRALPLGELLGRVEALESGSARPAAHVPRTDAARQQPRAPERKVAPPAQSADAGAFVGFVRKKYPPTAATLDQGSLAVDADRLRVAFPPGSLHADQLRDVDALARLAEMCEEFFGRRLSIVIEETLEKKNSGAERAERQQRKQDLERSALHNPVVQRVVETFNGKVVEVRTDG